MNFFLINFEKKLTYILNFRINNFQKFKLKKNIEEDKHDKTPRTDIKLILRPSFVTLIICY